MCQLANSQQQWWCLVCFTVQWVNVESLVWLLLLMLLLLNFFCIVFVFMNISLYSSSVEICCEDPWFTSIQEDGCNKGAHQFYLGTERNTPVILNWFQPCQRCCCLCYPGEYLRLGTLLSYTQMHNLGRHAKVWTRTANAKTTHIQKQKYKILYSYVT